MPPDLDGLEPARRGAEEALGDVREALGGVGHVEVIQVVAQPARVGAGLAQVPQLLRRGAPQPLALDDRLDGRGVAALVMGSTHYPILRRVIQEAVGASVRLIDSGEAAAEAVEALIDREGLRRTATQELRDLREAGAHARYLCDDLDHFYVTDAAERFAHVAERFLGAAPKRLEAVEVWGHDELQPR